MSEFNTSMVPPFTSFPKRESFNMSQTNTSMIPPFNSLASHYSHSTSQNLFGDRHRALISTRISLKKEDVTKTERAYAPPTKSVAQGYLRQTDASKILTGRNPLPGSSFVVNEEVEVPTKYFSPISLLSSHRTFMLGDLLYHPQKITTSSKCILPQLRNSGDPIGPTQNPIHMANLVNNPFLVKRAPRASNVDTDNNQPTDDVTKTTIDLTKVVDSEQTGYYGVTHSLPHPKHGPYKCRRCFRVFAKSQSHAAHVNIHYRLDDNEETTRKRIVARLNKKRRHRVRGGGASAAITANYDPLQKICKVAGTIRGTTETANVTNAGGDAAAASNQGPPRKIGDLIGEVWKSMESAEMTNVSGSVVAATNDDLPLQIREVTGKSWRNMHVAEVLKKAGGGGVAATNGNPMLRIREETAKLWRAMETGELQMEESGSTSS